MKVCFECYRRNDDDAVYCAACGKKLILPQNKQKFNGEFFEEEELLEHGRIVSDGLPINTTEKMDYYDKITGKKLVGDNYEPEYVEHFDWSKLLCPLFAAIMIALMLVPWIKFNVFASFPGVDDIVLGIRLPVYNLYKQVSRMCVACENYAQFVGLTTDEYHNCVSIVNNVMLGITAYFAAAGIVMFSFGIIGAITNKKMRNTLGNIGLMMMLIGTGILLIITFVGGLYVRDMTRMIEDYEFTILIFLRPHLWLVIAFMMSVLLKTLGMKRLQIIANWSSPHYLSAEDKLKKINKKLRKEEKKRKTVDFTK